MENITGYIDDKPFESIDRKNQQRAIINMECNGIEFNIIDNKKYDTIFKNNVNEVYAVDNTLREITAWRTFIKSCETGTIIQTCRLKSELFFYNIKRKKDNLSKFQHFTEKTKISKIFYYNDSISKVFPNKNFRAIIKNDKLERLETVKIETKKVKKNKLYEMDLNDNKIKIFLNSSYNYTHSLKKNEKLTITDDSNIVLKFQKGVYFDEAYDFILLLDSLFYLMTFTKHRHKNVVLYDFRENKYELHDFKTEKPNYEVKYSNYVIEGKKNAQINFGKIFKVLYKFSKKSKNSIFPFWEYDNENSISEIKFLEYYRTLEYLTKIQHEKKETTFLKNILEESKEVKEEYFEIKDVGELEEEIRSLRNYYSHEGYYIDELPIPTENAKRTIKVTKEWLRKVLKLVETLAYVEMFKSCNIDIKWNEIIDYAEL